MVCRNICLGYPRTQVGYLAGGSFAEGVNTIFLREGCFVNPAECD
jgi:hypothetical protein